MTDKIYFVAGETSGDNHGAALLRALRQRTAEIQFLGRGGPKMRAIAGEKFRNWIDDVAVVGLWEVVKRYGYFRRQFADTIAEIVSTQPDAVVLIDYPGFNLRLAHALRAKFPAVKIIYYISPQVWAWNRRRITQMAESIDLMLCIFPFEPDLYQASGLRSVFVGHPLTSSCTSERAGAEGSKVTSRDPSNSLGFTQDDRDLNLVGLFPGSRQREVRKIFPVMRDAAVELLRSHPDAHFEIAAASDPLAAMIRIELGDNAEKFSVRLGDAPGLMRRAHVAMIASGTATLEAALSRLPFVLVYRVSWITYFAARLVVKVKYLGMPNVLANREIVPEFIQHHARPHEIASAVARLLSNGEAREQMLRDFGCIANKLGQGEAATNAANAILAELGWDGTDDNRSVRREGR